MMRPVVVLLGFPLFCRHFAVFESWSPNSPFSLFDPQNGPSALQKHYKSDVNSTMKLGENTRRTNGSIFIHVQYSSLGLLPDPEATGQKKLSWMQVPVENEEIRVCTMRPERRLYIKEASDPEKEKRKDFYSGGLLLAPKSLHTENVFLGNSFV